MKATLLLAIIATFVACTAAVSTAPTAWTITARARTASDPQFTGQYAAIFDVNGSGSPEFTTPVGTKLTFSTPGLSGHQFSVFNSASPAGGSSANTVAGTQSAGTDASWTPDTAGVYYYGCTFAGHSYMGNKITVTSGSGTTGGSSSTSTGGAAPLPDTRPSTLTICNYYAQKLGLDQQTTISKIVVRAIVGSTGTTPVVVGLANTAVTQNFFNAVIQYRFRGSPTDAMPTGVTSGQTPNFVGDVPSGVQSWLIDHLTRFFGTALGCDSASFPIYSSVGSMYNLHANMNITKPIFTAFNQQVTDSAQSFGVSAADASIINTVLLGFNRNYLNAKPNDNMICTDPTCDCVPTATGIGCNLPVTTTADASSTAVSFLAVAAAALVAFVAARV